MSQQWTREQAWAWYDQQPWIVGCNYVPFNCINSVEIWQEEGFARVFAAMEREVELAAAIGLNSVRMMLPIRVWSVQRQGLHERLERVLDLLDRHAMTMMPILFDDCERAPVEFYSGAAHLGRQPEPIAGWHGGYPPRPEMRSADPTYHMADDPANWPMMKAFVKDITGAHRSDPRILLWDIWNEPGNTGAGGYGGVGKSLQVMTLAFGWARESDPQQPLTAGCWDFYHGRLLDGQWQGLTEIEQVAVGLSDVVSYHYYGDLRLSVQLIDRLKSYGRPLFITEWLHRPFRNFVQDHLPLFQREKIACYHWGLVNGKSQTHEPWDWIRDMDLDFSRWQHDLFYPDGTPYRDEEIALFRTLTQQTQTHQARTQQAQAQQAQNGKKPHHVAGDSANCIREG